jgi:hypothetical protein
MMVGCDEKRDAFAIGGGTTANGKSRIKESYARQGRWKLQAFAWTMAVRLRQAGRGVKKNGE